jgi:hypothetical protein
LGDRSLLAHELVAQMLRKLKEEAEHLNYLRSIKHIAVSYPNPILQTFSLVDTPGLASSYADDSQNVYQRHLSSTLDGCWNARVVT